jgi:serine/threonine protein kinase
MFCSQCGTKIDDDSAFCSQCGRRVTRAPAATPAPAVPPMAKPAIPGVTPAPPATPGSGLTGAPTEIPQAESGATLRGRFRIIKELGRGGMGIVYLAEDQNMAEESPRRRVALKLLPAHLSASQRWVELMRREFDNAARLANPHVVRMWDFDRDEALGAHFLVMEYVEGPSLDRVLAEKQRLSVEETAALADSLCSALEEAREHKVLHRDIKPANVMVPLDGGLAGAKLADFGVARLVRTEVTRTTGQSHSGTLMYNSPEQFRGRPMDHRSDIYSVGAVLWECLAGQSLISPDGDVGWQLVNEKAEPAPDAPEWLNEILLKCLAKKADERFADAAELRAAFAKGGSGAPRPAAAAVESHPQELRPPSRDLPAPEVEKPKLAVPQAILVEEPKQPEQPKVAKTVPTEKPAVAVARKCPGCGAKLGAGDTFCTGCGKGLAAARRCAACGQFADPDDEFCMRCGKEIETQPPAGGAS